MEPSPGPVERGLAWPWRGVLAGLLVLLAIAAVPTPMAAWQPPSTTAAQDGFVPLDESKVQERVPAAPILMAAYAIAWVVIFGYVWTLWSRLSRVEREIVEVSRRIDAGSRR